MADFSYGKQRISPKVQKIKKLCGGVEGYAVQASVRIDVEVREKNRFRMETSLKLTVFSSQPGA